MAAMIAMITTTINSSTSEKPFAMRTAFRRFIFFCSLFKNTFDSTIPITLE
jgi:hypothetical protein